MSDLSPFDLLFFGQHSHFLDNHLFDALDFYPDHSEGLISALGAIRTRASRLQDSRRRPF
jgi:hypothetical protein